MWLPLSFEKPQGPKKRHFATVSVQQASTENCFELLLTDFRPISQLAAQELQPKLDMRMK